MLDDKIVWEHLIAWANKHLDDRSISDAARWWADREAEIMPRPTNNGEWKASMEAAFEAGRQYEALRRYHLEK